MGEDFPEKEPLRETPAAEPPPDPAVNGGHPERGNATNGIPEPSPHKADILNRAIARLIDILVALLLARLPGYAGFTLGLLYLGIADGLFRGASVGKRIIGLRVLKSPGGAIVSYRESVLRNSTLCILYAALWIPIVGWAVALVGAGFEFLLMLGSPEGKRLGDEIASTVVHAATRRADYREDAGEDAGANEIA